MIGRLLGESRRVVQRQVAVDLVGRDMVKANVMPARSLQQRVRAAHIGLQEGLGIRYRIVVVRLRREVHAGISLREQAVHQRRISDVAHDELDAFSGQPAEILRIAGIGELIKHGDANFRLMLAYPMAEARADEPGPSGDNETQSRPPSVGTVKILAHFPTA